MYFWWSVRKPAHACGVEARAATLEGPGVESGPARSVRTWLSGRASPSHGGGRWFESTSAHHSPMVLSGPLRQDSCRLPLDSGLAGLGAAAPGRPAERGPDANVKPATRLLQDLAAGWRRTIPVRLRVCVTGSTKPHRGHARPLNAAPAIPGHDECRRESHESHPPCEAERGAVAGRKGR
jgi:hypothetical protein